jgi:hypothetical protein
MPAPKEGGFLAQHGATLIDNGYAVIPIQVGKKAPGFDGWQKARSTKPQLAEWVEHGHRWSGVGIITKHNPAIDIDVRDEAIALELEAWVRSNIGDAPMRIGSPPKRLFVFRTDAPFRKMRSAKYKDEWNDQHQIEILGDGQQFVAYHMHPDTRKPYYWPVEGQDPLTVSATDLIELTVEKAQALIDLFETIAVREGWELVKAGRQSAGKLDPENPWAEDSSPVDLSSDELRRTLMMVPNAEDHDTWVQVGMSLYHQFDGDDEGLELWEEWAETADNFDRDALHRRWGSFDIEGKKRSPITARYILKLAKEAAGEANAAVVMQIRDAFLNAKDLKAWEAARDLTQQAEINSLDRSSLAAVAKAAHEGITKGKSPLTEIKKALAFKPKRAEKTPGWCEPWVYDVSDDRFYNTISKIACTQQGFNAMYDRKAMTRTDILNGNGSPSATASVLALNRFSIPAVMGRRYMPGLDSIYSDSEGMFANTYAEHGIPAKPEKVLPIDKRNIERVKRHIAHLLEDEREQRMLLDWMSWVVQNPGKHVNYAILLQGVQGDGKTFFAEMMRAVMGVTNVTMLNAHILENDFTDWAEGQCLAAVEEVRLINERNKYEIINRIKPFITNNIIEIHPKGKPVKNVKNTTSYMLFTNYRDALPLDDSTRRYLVLFSRWQRKTDIDEFKADNPDYYEKLYSAIEESPGALRQWLLEHEQAESFKPLGDAPMTDSLKFMIRRAKPELIQVLEDLINDNNVPGISEELVSVTEMTDHLVARGAELPAPKTMTSMLERAGYEHLGRLEIAGETHRFWSRQPDSFRNRREDGETVIDSARVRSHLRARAERIASNEL